MVQLSHLYMTTGKTTALTAWTFVGKVISLLFNMQSRLIITFLPRSKRFLISRLQSPSAVIFIYRSIKLLLQISLLLKLKLQYFGHLMRRVLIGKDSDAGRDWGQKEKGTTEDEMAGWHHRLDGHESGWTPGVGDGQGGLVCCDSWGCKESGMTERLNWILCFCQSAGVSRAFLECLAVP